jgi:hypothetical protein
MNSPDRSHQLLACAERIDALAQRCSAFLRDQLSLVRAAHRELESAAARPAATPAELLLEKSDWEKQKAVEQAQIEEQIRHLTNAWKELEVEQRRLMLQGSSRPRTAEADRPEASSGEAAPGESSLDLVDAMPFEGVSSAAMQFQRLKREIRHQSRRRR